MSEPDPNHMTAFGHEHVVTLLREMCGVEAGVALWIGDDILARAQDFSTLEQSTQNVLVAPFIEEAFHHEPKTASARLKAAVVVVVRNSLLEGAHADGPVDGPHLRGITDLAAGPLSHLLAARDRAPITTSDHNQFAQLSEIFPRAWRAVSALVLQPEFVMLG